MGWLHNGEPCRFNLYDTATTFQSSSYDSRHFLLITQNTSALHYIQFSKFSIPHLAFHPHQHFRVPPQGGDQLRNQIQAINSQKLGAGQAASLPPPPAARPGPQAGPAGYGAPAALPPRPVTLAPPPRPSAPPPAVCTSSYCHSLHPFDIFPRGLSRYHISGLMCTAQRDRLPLYP